MPRCRSVVGNETWGNPKQPHKQDTPQRGDTQIAVETGSARDRQGLVSIIHQEMIMTPHLKIKAENHKASGQLLKLFIPLSAPKSGLVFNSYHRLSHTLSTKLQNPAQITTIRQDEVCCRCPRLCCSRPRPIQGGCPPLCPPLSRRCCEAEVQLRNR